ncbi:S-layer homology domain-containing protein [Paenibacillus sp. GCM10012307]|uniref:S-layer homology domain-containing protein n=1 Tax=Paenibacillus roseus TaxID=2798579 RepID=A0A934J0A3_9BACL|nr:S-layer homology domain-containing protein [Paenibacillus roseus]MBJ6362491.1 S-layer homology domain-containing protein [Paenibacillus roseus]
MGKIMNEWGKRIVACSLILTLLAQLIPIPGQSNAAMADALTELSAASEQSASSLSAKTDISGHWAETTIQAWLQEGLVSGFPDGSFRPDSEVKRAELAAIINRTFQYTKEETGSFTDVSSSKWYALDVARAKAAGYMKGDGKGLFRPEAFVTREEAAVIIANLLHLDTGSKIKSGNFADAKSMANWSRGAISAVADAGIMKGYDGNLFKARKPLTRAEAVVLLDHARKRLGDTKPVETALSIDKAGTYGPDSGTKTYSGDVAINVPNVVLKNVTIKGNLLLGEGIGEGDVTLDRVVVEGTTTVKGGGKNSIHILDSALSRVVITKVDGQVRVVIEGSTAVDQVSVESGATLQVVGGNGASYGTVKVSTTGEVTLDGDFPDVVIVAPAQLTVTSGKIGNLTLTEQAAGAEVTLEKDSQVTNVNAGAAATIKGDGKIDTASVTASGVTIEQKPAQTVVADGISANVGGTVTQGSGASGSGSSGSGSGGVPTVIRVTVEVSNPSASGFDLLLTPAVPNMTSTNIIMVNADGMPALVSKLRSTDQAGSSYRAEGFLTGGAVYTLSLAKPGYTFGASKTVSIPDVPAITGALVSPELTKLTLLFSKPLAELPAAPAGFTITDSSVPVAITGVTLSESATRLELALGAPVNPNALELKYVPGTIHSTDNKALPALTWRLFTDGSTPGGRAAYNRMLGKTAEQTADDLKNNASVSASVAAKALIEGGYNTNALIKALNTVYGITNENMPDMLLPQGISVYHLLIGMKEAGILNIQNLGKNFSYLNGQSDDWVRALKQVEYTDVQVVANSWFFPNVKLAASMRKYYDTSNERAAKLFAAYSYSSFSNDVGRVLKEVYGNDDSQAVSALKAADINASKAGMVLKDIYESDPNRTAELLRTAGYSAQDTANMFLLDYGATQEDTVKAMRFAGYTITEIYPSLGYAQNPAAAIHSAYTVTEAYSYLMSQSGRLDNAVFFLKNGGYNAVEAATMLLTNGAIRTRADLMSALLSRGSEAFPGMQAYNVDDALDAVRKKLGGSLTDLAAVLAQFNVPTVTTMQPREVTQVAALVRAGFNAADIVQWLAPSNTLTQAQASNIVLELRNAGYPLPSMGNVLKTLSVKVYSNSASPNLIRLLAASGLNTTTRESIPGYSATDIAKFLSGAGLANYDTIAVDLQLVFSKIETARAIAEASGFSMVDMLYFLSPSRSRMFMGSVDVPFLGQVLKDIYGLSSDEAVRALKGSSVPSMSEFFTIKDILQRTYSHTDTTTLIMDFAAGGFTMNQIGDGLVLNGAVFKAAGYSATEVAMYLLYKRTQMNDMALALHNLGYNLNEVTMALYNLYTGVQDQVVPQVTNWLSDPRLGYSSEDITAAVTAVFNINPFAAMAQSLIRGNYSATQAAVTLKETFTSTDSVEMARGLAAAGYSRDNVLAAVFQAYCDGYIYKEGALSTMDSVIAAVYPEVTNRLDATLKASDVRTAKYAISVMRSLGKSFEETIGVLERVYGLNSAAVLAAMLDNRHFGLEEAGIVNKVGAYYGLDPVVLYISWMAERRYKAYDVLAVVQQSYPTLDGVTIARLLNQAGYTKESILFAYDYNFHGDYVNEMALVMVQLFGSSDMQSVATELLQWGYKGLLVYPALKGAFKNKSQGDILVAMKQAGFTDLFDAIRYNMSNGDSTVIMQFRNLGLSLSNAEYLLEGLWKYSLRDTVRYLIELGYPLSDIGRMLSRPEQLVKHLRAMNYPLETVATIVYGADPRPSMLVGYMYNNGYTNIDDLVKALELVNCNPYDYAISLWFGPQGPWTLATIAQAVARNSTLTLEQLGQSLMQSYNNRRYFTDMQVYEALKSVANIGVSFIQSELDSAISAMLTDLSEGIPFAIMREAGLSSNDAARVMRKLGWDWIPACIQLVQAGYSASDTWGTLWDVYRNELGFQVLNIMSAVAPLASLGLAENLSTFQTVMRSAMRKAMIYYFTRQ